MRGRVVGKVTFHDKPVSEGRVLFTNDVKGIHVNADLKPDGTFQVIMAKGAGLPLETYKVCVQPPLQPFPGTALMGANNAAAVAKPKEYRNIPTRYREFATADLTLTVKEGENQFDISMKD